MAVQVQLRAKSEAHGARLQEALQEQVKGTLDAPVNALRTAIPGADEAATTYETYQAAKNDDLTWTQTAVLALGIVAAVLPGRLGGMGDDLGDAGRKTNHGGGTPQNPPDSGGPPSIPPKAETPPRTGQGPFGYPSGSNPPDIRAEVVNVTPSTPKVDLNKLPKKVAGQITKYGLPIDGMTPFNPKLVKNSRGDLEILKAEISTGPKTGKKGYVDVEGRIWIRDPGHAGYPDHWDVQIDGGKDYFRVGLDGNAVISSIP